MGTQWLLASSCAGFMRQNYPEVNESVHSKYGSVIRVEDCVEEEYEDEQPASIDME